MKHLEGLIRRGDRGALAALRRGLGKDPGAAPETYPLVVPWVPERASRQEEGAYYLVASLFALWHQGRGTTTTAQGGMGWSFDRLARAARAGREAVERRFMALLTSPVHDLPEHLRHAVSLLRAHEVPVDWAILHRDLRWWDHPDRWVQRRWARDFWGRQSTPEEGERQDGGENASAP